MTGRSEPQPPHPFHDLSKIRFGFEFNSIPNSAALQISPTAREDRIRALEGTHPKFKQSPPMR